MAVVFGGHCASIWPAGPNHGGPNYRRREPPRDLDHVAPRDALLRAFAINSSHALPFLPPSR
jgi:hypothetical protein